MEQARYWSHVRTSTTYTDSSWEEQAFAEDSAGPLGGFMWPPRSYSCSFCRREFKSAQALGGHMNVHRRDRARLNQSPTPHNQVQYPSQVSTLLYNPNPNSNTRVPDLSTHENCSKQTLVSPYSSVIVQNHQKGSLFSSPPSCSDAIAVRVLTTASDSNLEWEKNSREEIEFQTQEDYFNKRQKSDDEEGVSNKRQKSDASPTLPFFLKPGSVHKCHFQSEILGLFPSSMEELDLELRLGNRPKVK